MDGAAAAAGVICLFVYYWHGTSSEVQNLDRRDFSGNIKNTPLMSGSSRLDLDNELNMNDETHNDVDFEDGEFPELKPNDDRREHAHHTDV